MVKVASDQREVTLRDDRCGCDASRAGRSWNGYWAVMRIERTDRRNSVSIDVWARKIKDYADKPEIRQLE